MYLKLDGALGVHGTHLVHINPDDPAIWSDLGGGEKGIKAGATSQVDHRFSLIGWSVECVREKGVGHLEALSHAPYRCAGYDTYLSKTSHSERVSTAEAQIRLSRDVCQLIF